jgi:hypothetical protein
MVDVQEARKRHYGKRSENEPCFHTMRVVPPSSRLTVCDKVRGPMAVVKEVERLKR